MFKQNKNTLWDSGIKLLGAVLALSILMLLAMPAVADELWQMQPDSPEALGSISGTVTDPAGQPLVGIEVSIGQASSYYFAGSSQTVQTDDQGRYQLDYLKTSVYFVSAHDPTGQHKDTYYGGVADYDDAVEIPVVGNNITNVDVAMLPPTGISGSLSTSVALSEGSYSVTAYSLNESLNGYYYGSPYWERVDSVYLDIRDVSYSIPSLDPGTYRVCAEARGVLTDTNAEQSVGQPYRYETYSECYNDIVTGIETAEDVIVNANSMTAGIDFILGESDEYSSISGTVTDPDGNGIAELQVFAYSYPYPYPYPYPYYYARSHTIVTITDQNGQYTFDELLPITTTLFFNSFGSTFASEYYNDAQHQNEAEEFVLEAGSELTDVNAQLAIGGTISGKLSLQGNNISDEVRIRLERESVNPYDPEDTAYYVYYPVPPDAYDQNTGRYLIEGLPAGSYLLHVSTSYGLGGYYGGPLSEDAIPIAVELGAAAVDIDVSIAEGLYEGAIDGRVVSNGAPLAGVHVQLLDGFFYGPDFGPYPDLGYLYGGAPPPISYAVTDELGNYTIGGLTTGEYAIRFVDPDGDYARTFYIDGSDSAQISLEDGTTITGIDGDLETAATVSGVIQRTDGLPASYYNIVVEQNTEAGVRTIRSGIATDENGAYQIDGLPAGEYTLRFLPEYSYVTHLRLSINVDPGETVNGLGGIAGPGVPTSLQTINEPTVNQPQMTEFLFVPITLQ